MSTRQESAFQDTQPAQPTETPSLIDYRRVLFRALRYWYVVILSLLIALTAAFLINRYSTRIYQITTSIIIKESEESAEGKFVYNNALVNPYRNFYNELYIIGSYPLINSVITSLNYHVVFYREGNLKSTEAFNTVPVNFKILNSESSPFGQSFYFTILDEKTCKLEQFNENERTASREMVIPFNDSIKFNGYRFYVELQDAEKAKTFKDQKFLLVIQDPAEVTRSYVSRLKAGWAEQGSSVVNLDISGQTPSKEIIFLNRLTQVYQQYDLNKKSLAASRSLDFIDRQIDIINDSLKIIETQLERFKNKNVMTDMSGETLRLYEKIEGFELQKTELIVRENYFKYLQDYIQSNDDELDQIILPSSLGVNDQVLSGLITQMIQIQSDIRLNLESPVLAEKRRQVQQIKRDLLEGVRSLRSSDKIKRDYLEKQIKAVDTQLDYLPEAERRLVTIRRNYSLLENLYIFLMQKRAEAGISRASTTSDIVVVNPPRQVGGAITPKINQNYLIGGLVGLMLPFALFVLIEVLNNKVQSRDDIERITAIPFIGGVGHKSGGDNLIVHNKPKSSVAESFRALRSNLNYFTSTKNKKIFLITSSISGEGKTFTTINLGTVLAMSGKKTLIIGADLRKPKIFGDFQLGNTLGLSNYLSSMNSFQEVVQQTSVDNLYLLSSGPVPPNPSELLMSERMNQLIREAQAEFDFIVMDTPPVALVTDAFVLSVYADHTIFLVRQNYTPKMLLKNADELFAQGKIRHLSILLNDIQKTGPGYGYGYGYSYGYGYNYGYGYGQGDSYYEE